MNDFVRQGRTALLPALLCALLPASTAAQVVGHAVDFDSRRPVEGVEVGLLDGDRVVTRTLTDESGRFELDVPGPGTWRVTAESLGYRPVGPVEVTLDDGEVVTLELRLPVQPVEMEELVVVVRRAYVNLAVQQFHRRRIHGEETGFGYFLYGDELRSRGSARPSDVLRRVPGVRAAPGSAATGQIVRMQAGCIPDVYLDGMHLNRVNWAESLDPYVNTSEIEGIEVYRGSERPEGYYDPDGCGLVLVWTRNASRESGSPPTLTRWAVGIGLIAAIVSLLR